MSLNYLKSSQLSKYILSSNLCLWIRGCCIIGFTCIEFQVQHGYLEFTCCSMLSHMV